MVLISEEQVLRDAFAGRGARRHAKAVREIALEWKPDVIVRDEIDFGFAIAAETLGTVRERHRAAGRRPGPDVILHPIAGLRAEWGLAPDPN